MASFWERLARLFRGGRTPAPSGPAGSPIADTPQSRLSPTSAPLPPRDLSAAIRLIKGFEGVMDGNPATVNLDPYLDPIGIWTIGWGHAMVYRGQPLRGKEDRARAYALYPNGITREQAEALLYEDAKKVEAGLNAALRVRLSDTQFCALLSFAFNVGLARFRASHLRHYVNSRSWSLVPAQFRLWIYGDGKVLPGLVRRREAEVALWLTP